MNMDQLRRHTIAALNASFVVQPLPQFIPLIQKLAQMQENTAREARLQTLPGTPIDPALMSEAQAAHLVERWLHLNERKRLIELELELLKNDLYPWANARIDGTPDNTLRLPSGLLKLALNQPKFVYAESGDPVPKTVRLDVAKKLPGDYCFRDINLIDLLRQPDAKALKVLQKFGVNVVQDTRYDAKPLPAEKAG